MTLIEVVVALGLFAIMSTAVLAVLGSAIATTQDDRSRLAAINLATRELEITRDFFSARVEGSTGLAASNPRRGPRSITENKAVNEHPIDDTAPDCNAQVIEGPAACPPIVVDGVPYTVVREAQWRAIGEADRSPCDDGTATELEYLYVRVMVSWPALGDRPPVRIDTLMAPPKGTYERMRTESHIALRVVGADGTGRGGVTVTATSSTGVVRTAVTGEGDPTRHEPGDGCALVAHLAAGDWTLTASRPGFVDPLGAETATVAVHLDTGQFWRGSAEYDAAATITMHLDDLAAPPPGYTVPPGLYVLPLTLRNSGIVPIGARNVPVVNDTCAPYAGATPTVRTIDHLWPFPSGYEVWLGGYLDGSPGSGAALAATPPGGLAVKHVSLGRVVIDAAPGTSVLAHHDADSLCRTETTIPLGQTVAEPIVVEPTESPTASPTSDPSASPTIEPSMPAPTGTPAPTEAAPTEPPISSGGALRTLLPYGVWTIGGQTVQVGTGLTVVRFP